MQERFLVDASIDQIANPTYGLNPPPVLWWPVDPLFLEGLIPQRMDVRGLFIEYSRPAVARRYEASQDWRHTPQTDSAVLRILSTINNS